MPVADTAARQNAAEMLAVELRHVARSGHRPHVDQRAHAEPAQRADQVIQRSRRVPNRVEAHRGYAPGTSAGAFAGVARPVLPAGAPGAPAGRAAHPRTDAILRGAVELADVRRRIEDRDALASILRDALEPSRVFSHPADLLAYEYDGSALASLPDLVVLPTSAEEVAAVVRIASRFDVPLVARGSGTGLSGGAITPIGGINLDVTRAVERQGYFYAPDPSSQSACSIGGNVANNSGGVHTLAFGVTTNHVLGVEIVLPDASIVQVGGRGADAPEFDLTGLIVGSEGTLGIVTK